MKTITITFIVCMIAQLAVGQISFSPDITYYSTNYVSGVLGIDDFDSDGDVDVYTAKEGYRGYTSTTDAKLHLILNNGDGLGEQEVLFSMRTCPNTGYCDYYNTYSGMTSGDINGDGFIDFIAYEVNLGNNGWDQFTMLLSDGDGGFSMPMETPSVVTSNDAPAYPNIIDVDGDNDGDIVAIASQFSMLRWYKNQGDYASLDWQIDFFGLQNDLGASQIIQFDVTDDDLSDIITGRNGLFLFNRLLDNSINDSGLLLTNDVIECFQIVDWNNDGKKDIIYWNSSNELMLIEHFDGLTFFDPVIVPNSSSFNCTNNFKDPFILYDFDTDGFPEILCKDESEESISIYQNDSGVLGPQIILSNDIMVHNTAISDLDGDLLPDIVVSADSSRVAYFSNLSLSQGCTDNSSCNFNPNALEDNGSCEYPPYPYDCDLNCLNDADQNGICDEFEQAAPFNPDANGDGIINLLDMLEIFPLYGQPFEVVPCIGGE